MAPRKRKPAEPDREAEIDSPDELTAEAAADLDAHLEPDDAPHPSPGTALVRAPARALRNNSMDQYMTEVRRHPLLTRDEELALARSYRNDNDLDAAYRLVASNLRLVVKLAHEYHRNPLSLLDLVQEGNIGLMQAVKKYDPERGVKLSSYAAWWIRAYILRYIMDNWKMVKLGTTEAQRKLFFKLRQEQERLLQQGFEPDAKLLAERLNVTEQDVREMDQRLGHDEISLDAPLGEEGNATRADRFLPSGAVGAEEQLGNQELKELFHARLMEFSKTITDEKERYIFQHRLAAEDPDDVLTLQQIGTHYGLSRERARQIEAGVVVRLKAYMRQHIPDFDLVAAPKE